MAAPAAIAGSFADYRLIKSRSVLQLVIEIPVEKQAIAFDALGYPMPGIEIPVAVARLGGIPADAANPTSPLPAASDVAPDRGINRGNTACATYCGRPECYHGSYDDGPEMFRCAKSTGPMREIGIPQPRGDGPTALTPKARYAAMTAGEHARSRAGRLPREDERFRVWAAVEKAGGGARRMFALSEDQAAQFIRDRCCGGKSRRLIAEDPEAMDKFIDLETRFKIAVGEIAEPR